jgi:hypothetical protein
VGQGPMVEVSCSRSTWDVLLLVSLKVRVEVDIDNLNWLYNEFNLGCNLIQVPDCHQDHSVPDHPVETSDAKKQLQT